MNGFATYYRFAAAEVADDDFRSRAISLVMTGGIVAAVVGSSLASYFKDAIAGVPFGGTFLCMAVAQVLILMTVSFTTLTRSEAQEGKRGGRPLSRIARQPGFVMAILGAVTSYGVMSLLMNATPLSMDRHSHSYADTTQVIMWHVLGMYIPSFFTGYLILWFGEERIMLAGGGVLLLAILTSMGGTGMANYVWGLALLGIGWNFLFVGSTSLITGTYEPEEKAKVQSTNDFLVFGAMVWPRSRREAWRSSSAGGRSTSCRWQCSVFFLSLNRAMGVRQEARSSGRLNAAGWEWAHWLALSASK